MRPWPRRAGKGPRSAAQRTYACLGFSSGNAARPAAFGRTLSGRFAGVENGEPAHGQLVDLQAADARTADGDTAHGQPPDGQGADAPRTLEEGITQLQAALEKNPARADGWLLHVATGRDLMSHPQAFLTSFADSYNSRATTPLTLRDDWRHEFTDYARATF